MNLNENGHFEVGVVELLKIAKEFETPLYVYDADKIKQKYNELTSAFKGVKLGVNYACKALSNINILKYLKQLGAGLDTVSIEEVELGLKAGFAPQEIMFTPNCVSLQEIKLAVEWGVKINIDNISILDQFGHEYGDSVPVCIRVNPHIMAGGNVKISTGHIDSKFGISIHQMRHVERVVKTNNMRIEGLHMHTGSDILDVDVFLRGAEILMDLAFSFPDLSYLDFGSGFKVAYKPNDYTTDIQTLGVKMAERFNAFCKEYGRELELHFEPGKFLVSESGYFLVDVNVIKHTTATVFAGVNSGLNHLIRPMFYDAYHHITNLSNPNGTPRVYTVVGYICETDTFAWDRKIEEIKEGDVLCFHNAGAYCFSMASNYNSRVRPAEVLIINGEAKLIRERENLADILRNQIEVL
jgi:diaminopimelate decarboxylase